MSVPLHKRRMEASGVPGDRCLMSDSFGNFFYYKRPTTKTFNKSLPPLSATASQKTLLAEDVGNQDQYFPISQTAKRIGIGSYRSNRSTKPTLSGKVRQPIPTSKTQQWRSMYNCDFNHPNDRKTDRVEETVQRGYDPRFSVAFGMGYGSRHINHRMYLTSHDLVE